MKLLDPTLSALLTTLYAATAEEEHVVAWNLVHEEQVGLPRQGAYEGQMLGANDFLEWNAVHSAYVKQHVNVDRNGIAETFDANSKQAQFGPLEGNQWLVRVERLSRAFSSASRLTDFTSLEEAMRHSSLGDTAAQGAVDRFLAEWNDQRDGRPQFAAFRDEVANEFDSPDWPDQLRDRLGLGHLNPGAAGPIEVAVMVYPAHESNRRQHKLGATCTAAFTRPTVLDAELNLFFFPIPLGADYGATLHLGQGKANVLTQEVLHLSFDYKREHLRKIGRITHPFELGSSLSRARNTHLQTLQATGRGASWVMHP